MRKARANYPAGAVESVAVASNKDARSKRRNSYNRLDALLFLLPAIQAAAETETALRRQTGTPNMKWMVGGRFTLY